jgi:ABC-type uncharacterized transport system substrate-binding protein
MKRMAVFLSGGVCLLLLSCSGSEPVMKRVLYINSYHAGYGPSDEILSGIQGVFRGRVALQVFYMDTKQKTSAEEINKKCEEALALIRQAKPDLILVSDDNAVEFIIAPNVKKLSMPIVFCGVDWSAEPYELPTETITGILEIPPVQESLETVKANYPTARRLVVLSENTRTEERNKTWLDPLCRQHGFDVTYAQVDDFEQWKSAFVEANANADVIYLSSYGAIRNWNDEEARAVVHAHIQKPVFTCNDFMMSYAVFGLTTVPRQQGEWAASTAVEILLGKSPRDIPVKENTTTSGYFNTVLAEKIGFEASVDFLSKCTPVK